LDARQAAPDGSIMLLHGCAHNPTGVDPTKEQWQILADTIKAKNHLSFFDVAYQVNHACLSVILTLHSSRAEGGVRWGANAHTLLMSS
jgi:hypothetical protein